MIRIRHVVALQALLVTGLDAQQLDTTLWTRLRYRFVGPEGNRAIAGLGEPGNPLVSYVGAASAAFSSAPRAAGRARSWVSRTIHSCRMWAPPPAAFGKRRTAASTGGRC